MKSHDEGVGLGISEPLEQLRYGEEFHTLQSELSETRKRRQKGDGETNYLPFLSFTGYLDMQFLFVACL